MERLKRFLIVIEWILFACIPILAAIRAINPGDYEHPVVKEILKVFVSSPLSSIIWISILALILKFTNQEIIAQYLTNQDKIKKILNSLHKTAFSNISEDQLYQQRVTLFKASKRVVTRTKYLKMIARSGEAYLRSHTFFIIDDNDPGRNEGIAGRAWITNAQCIVPNLPEWPIGATSDNTIRSEYARLGRISMEKAERLTVKSRSIMATVVRNSQGKKWGVLTIDSQDPTAITMPLDKTIPPDKTTVARLGAELLTQIL